MGSEGLKEAVVGSVGQKVMLGNAHTVFDMGGEWCTRWRGKWMVWVE